MSEKFLIFGNNSININTQKQHLDVEKVDITRMIIPNKDWYALIVSWYIINT